MMVRLQVSLALFHPRRGWRLLVVPVVQVMLAGSGRRSRKSVAIPNVIGRRLLLIVTIVISTVIIIVIIVCSLVVRGRRIVRYGVRTVVVVMTTTGFIIHVEMAGA